MSSTTRSHDVVGESGKAKMENSTQPDHILVCIKAVPDCKDGGSGKKGSAVPKSIDA